VDGSGTRVHTPSIPREVYVQGFGSTTQPGSLPRRLSPPNRQTPCVSDRKSSANSEMTPAWVAVVGTRKLMPVDLPDGGEVETQDVVGIEGGE